MLRELKGLWTYFLETLIVKMVYGLLTTHSDPKVARSSLKLFFFQKLQNQHLNANFYVGLLKLQLQLLNANVYVGLEKLQLQLLNANGYVGLQKLQLQQ